MKWFAAQSVLRKFSFLLYVVAIVAFGFAIATANQGMQWLGLVALVLGAVFMLTDVMLRWPRR